jgi:saccharopine dehydrogenase (NAD+, L-lysine-forming)
VSQLRTSLSGIWRRQVINHKSESNRLK